MRVQIDFNQLATDINRHRRRRFTNRQYRALYFLTPEQTSIAWNLLQDQGNLLSTARPHHLLWHLNWLRTYATEDAFAIQYEVHRDTFRVWNDHLEEACGLLGLIRWEDRFDGDIGNLAKVSVDGSDKPIQEIMPFDEELYSHKLNAAGLRYEIGVCIMTGLIVWINGPFKPGPNPDLNISRQGLTYALNIGEWCVGDAGYFDGWQYCLPKKYGPPELQQMTADVCARHETVNARYNICNACTTKFRHGIDRHGSMMDSLSNLVQLTLLCGNPLYSVDHYDDSIARELLYI